LKEENKHINFLYFLLIVAFLLAHYLPVFGTHNRAGEITYEQISALKFRVTIITFTNSAPNAADRPELEIQWGDNTSSVLPRIEEILLPDYYKRNKYIGEHTYPGPGQYTIVVEDPNRNAGVQNIPNSVTVPFSIKTTMLISPDLGVNNTPILLNPPVDKAALDQIFIHNPAAFDIDGDSISYKLTKCTGQNGEFITGYTFPPASNSFYVDEVTGDLIWDAPVSTGIFNVAILIEEWRSGIRIGRIVRDMQIEVYDAENSPPVINDIPDKCLMATDYLEFTVTATDPDDDPVNLSASSGAFEVLNPAFFIDQNPIEGAEGIFYWNSNCINVRKQPYLVVFKAEDQNEELNLVDIKNMNIKVIAPPPLITSIEPSYNSINLEWKPNDSCVFNEGNVLSGYKIFRSNAPVVYNYSPCQPGIPDGLGYQVISLINDKDSLSLIDDNFGTGLPQGFEYGYRVVAFFEDDAQSFPSNEASTELYNAVPEITNLSVIVGDEDLGEIFLEWQQPIEIDTLSIPLIYKVFRSTTSNGSDSLLIDSMIIDSIDPGSQLFIIDDSLNTIEFPYYYIVHFYSDNNYIGPSSLASTIYGNAKPADNQLELSIECNVPWQIDYYEVLRQKQDNDTAYDTLGLTFSNSFLDLNLVNGNTYCYKFIAHGGFVINNFPLEITSISHLVCGVPVDIVAPCPPRLTVTSDCELFTNQLIWEYDYTLCDDDVVDYHIYYTPLTDYPASFIHSTDDAFTTNYSHEPEDRLGGCYYVTAVDSFDNESRSSNRVCIDICEFYEVPNVFSPGNDDINEFFVPLTSADVIERYVDRVDVKIYNRWGNLVFQTDELLIKWDGKSMNNDLVSTGVYYYVIDVYEKRITGTEPRYIYGFIHVFTTQ